MLIRHFTIFFLFLSILAQSQVVINEYSAANLNGFKDSFQKTEDWIELYNTSNEAFDLSGWHLSDKETKPTKWVIPAGTTIGGNEYLIFLCSGRDMVVNGELHTSFKLSQTKDNEFIILSDTNGNVVESYKLNITLTEHSHCREIDGTGSWGICTEPTYGSSNDSGNKYMAYSATPSIIGDAGFYTETQAITIENNEPNSTLRYTTNGRNVTEDSPEYTGPIEVSNTTVIKARAFSNDSLILAGKMDFKTFFMNEDFSLPVYSVAADDLIELANGQGSLIPIGSLELFDTDKKLIATSWGDLNRHGQDSWALDHRSIDWISRDEMGYSRAVEAKMFNYSDRDEYQRFMFRNSGDDNYPAIDDFDHRGSTHIRDEYIHQLAQDGDMKLDVRAVERVIVFLNGEYWGLYGMRQKMVDHDYTEEYYDQGKYDIQYLATWGTTEMRYGGQQGLKDWRSIRDFVMNNDMSIEENYQKAEDSINMVSMIDYLITNLNVVASDWLNYNTGWWRGLNPDGDHKKWGYTLWDLDASFDYYINYSGVPNTDPDALPCDLEDIVDFVDDFLGPDTGSIGPDSGGCPTFIAGEVPYAANDPALEFVMDFNPSCCNTEWSNECQNEYDFFVDFFQQDEDVQISGNIGKHGLMFLKLLEENETFKQLYYSRYADLMNTVFSCENMNYTLDSMLNTIIPEMPRQIDRWGGTMQQWEDNVNDLKDFINERCDLLANGALECYPELNGPYQVTLQTRPNGVGEIDLNTLDIETFPWTGSYFGGMENNIKAKVFNDFEDTYQFSHWETSANNIILPTEFDRRATINLTQNDTLTAVFTTVSSINKIESISELEVFPNPTTDLINIKMNLSEATDLQLSISDILGKQLVQYSPSAISYPQGTTNITLSSAEYGLSNGIYMINIRSKDTTMSRKISVVSQ